MANHTALVSILCEDRPGLIADVTGRLYDLGINLGDTTFAVLGSGAKLTLVAKLPSDISIPDVEEELRSIPVLRGAAMTTARFSITAAAAWRCRWSGSESSAQRLTSATSRSSAKLSVGVSRALLRGLATNHERPASSARTSERMLGDRVSPETRGMS